MVFLLNKASIQTKVAITASAVRVDLSGIQSNPGGNCQVILDCKTTDAVINFGDSTVTASNTYTSDNLPAGNKVLLAGAIQVFEIPPDVTHASVICEDGASMGGYVFITAGKGER